MMLGACRTYLLELRKSKVTIRDPALTPALLRVVDAVDIQHIFNTSGSRVGSNLVSQDGSDRAKVARPDP